MCLLNILGWVLLYPCFLYVLLSAFSVMIANIQTTARAAPYLWNNENKLDIVEDGIVRIRKLLIYGANIFHTMAFSLLLS